FLAIDERDINLVTVSRSSKFPSQPSTVRRSESPSPPPTERRRIYTSKDSATERRSEPPTPPLTERCRIYTPEDSAGAPLTTSLSFTSRARSTRRQSRRRSIRDSEPSSFSMQDLICVPRGNTLSGKISMYSDEINQVATVLSATTIKSKPPKIETLYNFLDFQSFDGSFLPSANFYSWFGKNNFKDFEVIGIENEKVLCLTLALAYLEIIMFETFKDECEICYEKAKKALKKEVGGDEQKINEISEKIKEWVNKWADE
ncbi:767_t:CDS:2, partial [Dentiscutata heterogama]